MAAGAGWPAGMEGGAAGAQPLPGAPGEGWREEVQSLPAPLAGHHPPRGSLRLHLRASTGPAHSLISPLVTCCSLILPAYRVVKVSTLQCCADRFLHYIVVQTGVYFTVLYRQVYTAIISCCTNRCLIYIVVDRSLLYSVVQTGVYCLL